jgi:hypothetical protein
MTTLISLVSDQTLPNVLFIEAVKEEVDLFVFLVTAHTEKVHKTDTIIRTCQLQANTCRRVLIDPESYPAILQTLEQQVWDDNCNYLVNITGGTKMMALAAKDFFEKLPDVESFYIPVGHQKAYSLKVRGKEILLPELTLKQYLLAHAYTYTYCNKLEQPHQVAANLFKEVIRRGHAGKVTAISHRIDKSYLEEDKKWHSGEWFEEWLFVKLKETLRLDESRIVFKAKLKHQFADNNMESDNEFDVIFVRNNKLYLIEAKVYTSESINASKTIVPLYKIASQQSTLGLHANSIVIILAPLWHDAGRTNRINDLKRVLRINHVWDLNDMKNYQKLFSNL